MTYAEWSDGLRLLAAYREDDRNEGALAIWLVDHVDVLMARPPALTHDGGAWPKGRTG